MISKIYEFLDTVILVLKKKEIIFLHLYHHFITLILCFVMMEQVIAAQSFTMAANCTVHIFMYYYYALSALGLANWLSSDLELMNFFDAGIQVWWKRYITQLQIFQFVLDAGFNMIVTINHFQHYGTPNQCSGNIYSWIFGHFVLTSFLLLFIHFFIQTYILKQPKSTKAE